MKPVWGLINKHNRCEFEIHLFSDAPVAGIQHGYEHNPKDRLHEIGKLSNEAVADLIRKTEIDVLVDLNGYSKLPRLPLFALHPAPVVCGWFNLYGTSGMDAFDYLIGDDHVVLPNEECYYTEKVLRVRGSWLTFEPLGDVPSVAEPPCLRNGAFTFGSMASQYKITTAVVAAWSQILSRSPNSSLILKNRNLGSSTTREFVHRLFEDQGITRERIVLEGWEEYLTFLRTYDRIDIALETWPYNGGTTTTDAIWQGVPVVTFAGDRWASRMTTSILRCGGLSEFVASNLPEYIDLAVGLAISPETPERLLSLRRRMRSQLLQSPVCDTVGFTREMESLYLKMHERSSKWAFC
jgi:predicted O-linked N-acetylglucosamine transferase (SPINDLY family)